MLALKSCHFLNIILSLHLLHMLMWAQYNDMPPKYIGQHNLFLTSAIFGPSVLYIQIEEYGMNVSHTNKNF